MTVSSMPPQWSSSTLSDVTTIIRGVTYKKAQASNQPFTGSLAILRANNIQGGNVIAKDLVYVPSDFVKPHQRLLKGDIVVAMSSGSKAVVGKTARIKENFDGSFGAFCGVLRPVSKIIPTYLAWFTHSLEYRNRISSLSAGANINNLKPSHFDEIQIPLAPLAEQKVIADKLDTLLSQVENTKARLERIPQILKRFRQSVLAAAVSGRLTEEWRKDKQLNAPEQLQAIRTRYPSKPAKEGLAKFHELPQTWDWALVKEVGDVQLGRQRAPKYHQGTNMRPYLRVANVMEGYIDTRDIMEMEFNEKDYERYRLSEGDILLNEGQSHELVGRPAMFKGEVEGACFTNTLVRFRPRPGVSGNFAYMVFLSYLQSGRFQQIASRTVNISHLGAGRFADMEFPFPTLEEQTEIVRRVDQLFAHADRIEQQINNSLTRVNNLTQSILAKAFRGELTEQWRKDNPERISGENSAEALLERIKAERAAVAKPKRRKANA